MVNPIKLFLTVLPFTAPFTGGFIPASVVAQITPALDATGTLVSPSGDRINISGGRRSGDGTNLFHSFERFNLSPQQTATFLSHPQIQTIFGRVVGGDASVINGLIQVAGGPANLYLINPAGILFGPNARLDVPGSFTATTATAVGFGSGWFHAWGSNDYSMLVGHPQSLGFALSQPGAIANLGSLAVNPGQSLTLLGGTVLNTGTLSAPGGNITIAAVAGGSLVRISQAGSLINFEVNAAPAAPAGTAQPLTPVSLPALLTGGDLGNADSVMVAADGTVRLMRSPTPIATALGSTTVAGTLDVAGPVGGSIHLLGTTIGVQDATLNATGAIAGGTIRIGGDFRGLGPLPTATHTGVDQNSSLNANAELTGNGGQVVIWADQSTRFDGRIQARGGSNGGNGGMVEVSGKEALVFRGDVDTSAPRGTIGTLLLDPQNIVVVNGSGAADDSQLNDGRILAADGGTSTFTISEQKLESLTGMTNVTLEATNDITINDLTDNALTFQTGTGAVVFQAGGSFVMNAGDTIRAEQRSVSITATNINAGAINTSTSASGKNAGAITLTATSGAISTGALNAGTQRSADDAGRGGNVTLTATTDITVDGEINASASIPTYDKTAGDGGTVSLSTTGGNIAVAGDIKTFSSVGHEYPGNGGSITLSAPTGGVTAGNLDSRSATTLKDSGNAGAIAVTAGTSLNLGNISASGTTGDNGNAGRGGTVTLSASDRVTVGGISAVSQDAAGATALSQAIAITGNEIDLTGGANSVEGRSITLQPNTLAQPLNVGGAADVGAAALDLTTTDLAALKNGLTTITLGRSGGTGPITLFNSVTNTGSTPFQDPVNLAGGGTLVGPDQATTWTITGANTGQLNGLFANGLTFSNISNLTGGSADDNFQFTSNAATLSGAIRGGSGTDTLNYSAYTANFTLNLAVTQAEGVETILGGTGTNTLIGDNIANTWTVTGANSGTLNSTTFTNFRSLVGGSGIDAFTLTPGGSVTSIAGGAGSNRLIGPDAPNTWNITGVNAGTVAGVGSFTNLQTLTGGSSSDAFVFANGAEVTGLIDGGAGNDTLNYTAYTSAIAIDLGLNTATGTGGISNIEEIAGGSSPGNTLTGAISDTVFTITGVNAGTVGSVSFSGFGNLRGQNGNDTFTLNGGTVASIEGGAGSNAVVGDNTANTWSLTGAAAGTVNGTVFNTIQSLTGGTNNDAFVFSDGVNFGGAIAGNAGTDTFDYRASTAPLTVNLAALGASSIETVLGTANAPSTLLGTTANTWIITGTDAGTVNGTTFGNFQNLVGGTDTDTFQLSGGRISGTIDGSSGSNALIGTIGNDAFTLTGTDSGTVNGNRFMNIAALNGADGDDTFHLQGGSVGRVEGGIGNNTLLSDAIANLWTITGPNVGQVNGIPFSNIQNLTGGSQNDAVTFTGTTAQMSGDLAGGGGDLTLIGDKIRIDGSISGSGNLLIQPWNPSQGIQLGGLDNGDPGILPVTGATLRALQNGFNTVTIGHSDGSGAITFAETVAFADPVTLRSPNGSINTQGFNLTGTDNAAFTLLANQSITTATISTLGGAIALTGNSILTGNLTTQNNAGAGGNLTLQSQGGAIATGAMSTSGTTNGGNVSVTAGASIITGTIDTQGTTGNGGNVALQSVGPLQTASINTQAGAAGGNVDITTPNFFRATTTFTAADGTMASISTIGGSQGGSVTIRHGGNGLTPFAIGNSTINGTTGAITSGSFSIAPFQSFPGPYSLGNLALITRELPKSPESHPKGRPLPGLPFLRLKDKIFDLALDEDSVLDVERTMTRAFRDYLTLPAGEKQAPSVTLAKTRLTLRQVEAARGLKPALLYVYFVPSRQPSLLLRSPDADKTKALLKGHASGSPRLSPQPPTDRKVAQLLDEGDRPDKDHDTLELVLVTADQQPIRRHLWDVTRAQVLQVVRQFQQQVTDATTAPSDYLPLAQQLDRWMIEPVRADLERQQIKNIIFIMDEGLRSLPAVALHNGHHFLVEDYSISLMPSFSLTQLSADNIHDMKVLAMGASEFKEQSHLPAVPLELSTIAQKLWSGESLLNRDFTVQNLQAQRSRHPFKIVHLATHGEFRPGQISNSYIQFWDQKLRLDQVRQLGLQNPPVELLVLSACSTALGDEHAELGFAGMAVQAGVISSLASLWAVSDDATLGLMTEFYHQLRSSRTKVEALRQAQLAMINGKIRIDNGRLITADGEPITLPPELANSGSWNLTHPLYWSAFTLIGSPW